MSERDPFPYPGDNLGRDDSEGAAKGCGYVVGMCLIIVGIIMFFEVFVNPFLSAVMH